MKITRSNDETARRLRDALRAEADSVQPAEAWSTITDRLDRRPSPWAWVTQRPVLIGGAVVLVALLGFLAVSQLGGDDDETQVEVVDDPPSEDYSLVAVNTDGELVELDREGAETGVLGSVPRFEGGLAVSSVSGSVFAVERADTVQDCQPDEGNVRLERLVALAPSSAERTPVVVGAASAVAVSPSGDRLASVDWGAIDDCEMGTPELVIRSAEPPYEELVRHDLSSARETFEGALARPESLAWVDETRVAVSMVEGATQWSSLWLPDGGWLSAAGEYGSRTVREYLPPGAVIGTAPDGSGLLGAGSFVRGEAGEADIQVRALDSAFDDPPRPAPPEATLGVVDVSAELGLETPATVVTGFEPIVPLSVAAAPDGSVYLTTSDRRGLDDPDLLPVDDPSLAALFRISPAGETEKLAEGIVSVAIRPGAAEPDEPADDAAGPVVGARADGSLALLDPATVDVVEEFGPPEATDPPQGLAVASDGSVYYAVAGGPRDTMDCADDGTSVDEFIWRGAPEGDGLWSVSAPFPRGRMPMPSPDGSRLAFVSTSNGEMCDRALVVHVGDVATSEILATHTLAVGVEPTDLVWAADDRLYIAYPDSNTASGGTQTGVAVVDPLVSGPTETDFVNPALTAFGAGGTAAPGDREAGNGAPGLLVAMPDPDGTQVVLGEGWRAAGAPVPDDNRPGENPVPLPIPSDEGAVLTVAQDGAGTRWVTATFGEIEFPVAPTPDVRTYRLGAGETEAVQVSDEFVAVAASPFPATDEQEEPPTSTTEAPPATDAPPTTEEATTGTTTPPPAAPAYLYLTSDGAIVRATIGGDSTTVGQLDPSLGNNPILAPHPDGETLYLSLDESEPCASTLYALDLSNGQLSDVGSGSYPAVSADGTKLAYVERDPATVEGYCPSRLVVRDLATGPERRWRDPISHGASAELDASLRLMNLAWASDNRTIVLSASNEGDIELVVDTDQPEGDLVYRDVVSGAVPVRDPAVPDAEWWLVGAADLDGNPAVVVRGGCYAEDPCDGADVVRFVPLDGAPTVDTVVPADGYVIEVGPDGFLLVRGCEESACRGSRLSWLPIGGAEQELVPGEVETAAWLP